MDHNNIDELIAACLARIHEAERALWAAEPDEILLDEYQAAFQQMEQLIAAKGDDKRHEFIIIIPVADRPQHLKSCLESLLHLCKTFGYGGQVDRRFQKVSVIIADDSKEAGNINMHKSLANAFNKQGLTTLYFGLDEQLDLMDTLTHEEKSQLSGIIGYINEDAFYHKGPSIMRNIAYLELNKIQSDKALFYFIDSDQEFQLKINTSKGDKNLYACNYFHYLDQIFTQTDACILTGKVVGDPPVSPSVMTGNFIEDIISFLHQIAEFDPSLPCQFHSPAANKIDDAAYHDMAALFGFKASTEPYQYVCSIQGEHDNSRCMKQFTDELSRFFYGEHPTRKTYYQHENPLASIRPARTVYTGNYVFKAEALNYFIPFAPLKLRMAGPALGRVIKSELNQRFISSNLPMLHKRTVQDSGQSEFRPGVNKDPAAIDLTGEFERQFYGDVMLFTIEKLCGLGYPKQPLSHEVITATLETTHTDMLKQYNEKRQTILLKLNLLKVLLNEPSHWWNQTPEQTESVLNVKTFISNIEHNFGENSPGYKLISADANKSKRHAGIIASIANLASDRLAWTKTLSAQAS